jgi:N-acetylglucosamine kinase-like BadF-type ATPase
VGPVTAAVLAIDGGNSKTDVALVSADGTLLGHARGPGSCHQNIGIDATMDVLSSLVAAAATEAGLDTSTVAGIAGHAAVYLAGADLEVEVEMLHGRIAERGWAEDLVVDNDTFALLRAGTQSPDRVAVVCGAGINCVGVAADGRSVRFPSLGRISGDWGGGGALGVHALYLAVRAEDGRGAATGLRDAVASHFDCPTVAEVTAAIHLGRLPFERLHELVLVLFEVAAAGDDVARRVVDRLAREVMLMATVALRGLDLLDRPADIVLGGGVLAARDPLLLGTTLELLATAAPKATVVVVDDPPVVGAALLGMDAVGAGHAAERALRDALLARTQAAAVAARNRARR